jgi:hypothetical protein
MIKRFRNKPVYIEAVYFDGSEESYKECCEFAKELTLIKFEGARIIIAVEGENHHVMCYCSAGQWLVRTDKGLYFDIDSDLLASSYEEV